MSIVEKFLDIPPSLLSSEPGFELWGNKQLVMEGCKGILEYGENFIKISCGKYALALKGSALELKNMSENSLMITGNFESLSFCI